MQTEPEPTPPTRPTTPSRPHVAVNACDPVVHSWIVQALVADGLTVVPTPEEGPGPAREPVQAAPDLLVAGFGLADGLGAIDAFVRRLRRTFPDVRLVAVAPPGLAGPMMRGVMRARVDAVVLTSNVPQGLAPTVRAVYADQVAFPRCERRRAGVPALSFREKQVLHLAVHGRTNDEIAAELVLATSTIKSHLTSAFAKLCVHSRSEAAALVLSPDEPAGRALLDLMNGPPQPSANGAQVLTAVPAHPDGRAARRGGR
jgi:DNA-binding NarL/FixJ family response regulator